MKIKREIDKEIQEKIDLKHKVDGVDKEEIEACILFC